jgi:DNA-binding IclR family transcriptional regulator
MSSPRDRILKRLATTTEGAHTVSELADDLRIPVANTRRVVNTLVEEGRLEALGESASGARCYGITEAGRKLTGETT